MPSRFARRSCLLALIALASLAPLPARAQSSPAAMPAPVLQGGAFGDTAILNWTPVAGATSYVIGVGYAPDAYILVQDVGNQTTVAVPAAPLGTYYVRVAGVNAAGMGLPSNEVSLTVTGAIAAAPAAPVGLQATVLPDGRTAQLNWQLGAGGGPVTGLLFGIGTSPGAIDLGVVPAPVMTSATYGVSPGTYFARIVAVGPGGVSGPSNEMQLTVGGVACPALTPSNLLIDVNGANAVLAWTPSPGAAVYRLDVSATPGGPLIFAQPIAASETGATVTGAPAGTYYVRMTAVTACGTEATSNEVKVEIAGGGGNRTPDPPPGQRLPLPNRFAVVEEVAQRYPGDLANSCRDNGGNNTWLFRLVQRLRQEDTRWGLNWKRGVVGDMSQDVITYHFGAGADEGSTDVYILDVIANHCASNPGPSWQDKTESTRQGNTIGRWTLQPYLNAGFQP